MYLHRPPYNTGNENWVYNDKVNSPKIKKWLGKIVGGEAQDLCRHDKWLCMMYPRLKLLRDLLSDDGVIFVSIDDNEYHNLKTIMDEIFGDENFISNLIWKSKGGSGTDAKHLAIETEYILLYGKKKENIFLNRFEADISDYKLKDEYFEERGFYKLNKLDRKSMGYIKSLDFPIKIGKLTAIPGGNENNLKKWRWRWSKDKVERGIRNGFIILKKDKKNNVNAYYKLYQYCDNEGNIIKRKYPYRNMIPEGISTSTGNTELSKLFEERIFDYPKSSELISHLLKISSDKDSIILDSFAGSGTTGHAVLDLNKEDGGNRKFILIEMEDDIAKKITAERIKRAIEKYDYKDGFEYCELDKPLFDENGQIEETCDFNQFATYIYFTETQTNIDKKQIDKNFIGESGETEYYLIYKEKYKNVLNKSFLSKLKKTKNKKVIYADFCMVDDDTLEKLNIQFKQIPYEVKVY